jgi:predicted transcriptional regulator
MGDGIPSNPETTTSLYTQKAHMEEEAIVASVETKNIRQDSVPERGGKDIERGLFIQTGKKVAINKWLQSGKERDNAYLYQQTFGRKVLGRESEIRRISQYKEREQNYEGQNPRCYKELRSSGNIETFNTLVQPVQAGIQSEWGHEISSRYERSQSIYGSETFQNGRNFYFTRSHSEE